MLALLFIKKITPTKDVEVKPNKYFKTLLDILQVLQFTQKKQGNIEVLSPLTILVNTLDVVQRVLPEWIKCLA